MTMEAKAAKVYGMGGHQLHTLSLLLCLRSNRLRGGKCQHRSENHRLQDSNGYLAGTRCPLPHNQRMSLGEAGWATAAAAATKGVEAKALEVALAVTVRK